MKTILKTKTMILLAAVFVMYTGCSPAALSEGTVAPTQSSSNIFGGSLSTQDFQNKNGLVGLIITTEVTVAGGLKPVTREFTSLCTGTLIERRVVLTAAHCVTSYQGERIVAVQAYFKPNINLVTQKDIISADRLAVHPRYMENVNQSVSVDSVAWNDIALIRLSADAPKNIKTVAIANKNSTVVNSNSKLLLSGFGIATPTVREKVFNEKTQKWDVVEVQEKSPTSGILRQVADISVVNLINQSHEILLTQTNSKGACHGDSGGPAFLQNEDGSVVQVGVTSRGTNELGNCDEGAIYSNVAEYSAWIETTTARLVTTPRFDPNVPVQVEFPVAP